MRCALCSGGTCGLVWHASTASVSCLSLLPVSSSTSRVLCKQLRMLACTQVHACHTGQPNGQPTSLPPPHPPKPHTPCPRSPPVWENCPNRAFSVPAATVVTCAWDEPGATTCEPAYEDGSSDAINDAPAPAFRCAARGHGALQHVQLAACKELCASMSCLPLPGLAGGGGTRMAAQFTRRRRTPCMPLRSRCACTPPALLCRPATVVASYEANGQVKVEGRASTAVKVRRSCCPAPVLHWLGARGLQRVERSVGTGQCSACALHCWRHGEQHACSVSKWPRRILGSHSPTPRLPSCSSRTERQGVGRWCLLS